MEIEIYGLEKKLSLSNGWNICPPEKKFPVTSTIIQKETAYSSCMVVIYPINESESMPMDDIDGIIRTVHNLINDNQGIIEIKSGQKNFPYVYSIVKTYMEKNRVMQYCLSLHMNMMGKYYQVQGFFEEYGTTGYRDAVVLELMRRKDVVTIDENTEKLIGWFRDPYDPNFNKGRLMNLSEQEEFDDVFPYHPLSETRRFITELSSNKL